MTRGSSSGMQPRAWVVTLVLVAVLICLALAPVLFDTPGALETAAKICVLIVLVASFDLMIGFSGLVNFAHLLFFGIGAYGVALSSLYLGRGVDALAIGAVAGAGCAAAVALVIGAVALRGRLVAFALATLVVATLARELADHFAHLTGGAFGLSFRSLPELSGDTLYGIFPELDLLGGWSPGGQAITGVVVTYYLVFSVALLLFVVMRALASSSFGRRLETIRDNAPRASALGYSPFRHRLAIMVISAVIAALSGALFAIWFRHVDPVTTLGFELMVTVLLMAVIGGLGTISGAVIGVVLVVLAQEHLPPLMQAAAQSVADLPVVPLLLAPDRSLFWVGLVLVLCVYILPTGIVGRLRGRA